MRKRKRARRPRPPGKEASRHDPSSAIYARCSRRSCCSWHWAAASAEHSGVINLGLEGIMVIGALGGALTMRYLPAGTSQLCDGAAGHSGEHRGSACSIPCCWPSPAINCKADQTIVGTAHEHPRHRRRRRSSSRPSTPRPTPTTSPPPSSTPTPKKAFLVNIGSFEFNWFMLVAFIALVLCVRHALQDALRPAPDGLRRASAGGGQRRHQRL